MEPQVNLKCVVDDMADAMGKSERDALGYLMHCLEGMNAQHVELRVGNYVLNRDMTLLFLGSLYDGGTGAMSWGNSVQPDDPSAPSLHDFSFRLRDLREAMHGFDIADENILWDKWKYGRVRAADTKVKSVTVATSDAFDPSTPEQLAAIFPYQGTPDESKRWWTKAAENAIRNGLSECRMTKSKGKAKSLFDVLRVAEWLTKPKQGKTQEWVKKHLAKNCKDPDLRESFLA